MGSKREAFYTVRNEIIIQQASVCYCLFLIFLRPWKDGRGKVNHPGSIANPMKVREK